MIASPLDTPEPVTDAESVTVVDVTEATVVPLGITPLFVVSVTSIPATIEEGTDVKVSTAPDAVAALVARLMLTVALGGVAQSPAALRNLLAIASPAAGAGT
ncbi:MAG: hypothetical protein WAN43_09295 [Rhodomicrobium sp.]